MGDLTEHFDRREYACKCQCGLDRIDPLLADKVEEVRYEVAEDWKEVPFTINCGCRCTKHNAEVGGVESSAHTPREDTFCKAVDIACTDGEFRYYLLKAMLKHFRRVEPRETWIHGDVDYKKPTPCVFFK
jgi:uncharacterized protein YcbK (DUF882 family)